MNRVSVAALLVTVAALGTGAAIPAQANESAMPSNSSEYAPFAFQIAQRQRMGLDADSSYIASVEALNRPSDNQYGIPLTVSEESNLSTQLQRANLVTSLQRLLEPLGIWGGGWIQAGDADGVVIATTRALTAGERTAVDAVLGDVPLVIQATTATQSQLQAVVSEINRSRWPQTRLLTSVGANLDTGTVEVGVTDQAPQDVEAQLQKDFGPLVRVLRDTSIQTTSTRSTTAGKLYGGLWIHSGVESCTETYTNVRNAEGAGGYYGLTAGHCFAPGEKIFMGSNTAGLSAPLGASGTHNPVMPGSTTNCDCKQFGPIDQSERATNNILNTHNVVLTMTKSVGSAKNVTVCMSGAKSYEQLSYNQCGRILQLNETVYPEVNRSDGTFYPVFTDQDQVDMSPVKGDSGAPVYVDTDLAGLMAVRRDEKQSNGDIITTGFYSESINISTAGVTLKYN